MEFFHKVTRFPFMSTRKVWYGLSAALIVASISLVAFRGLNLGVDFTGGVTVETNFPQAPNIETLRSALVKAGIENAQVQAFGSSRDILVRPFSLPASDRRNVILFIGDAMGTAYRDAARLVSKAIVTNGRNSFRAGHREQS